MRNLWDPDVYNLAWRFATHAHADQTYGGPRQDERLPYINHLGSVTMEVMLALSTSSRDYNADLAVQCALLHDVIEDTEQTYADVAAIFGTAVADGVAALSKNEMLPTKQEQMHDSLERIQLQPHEVWMVKLADRITNLQKPPFYWNLEKKQNYQTEARAIYTALSPANEHLAQRLWAKIENYADYIKEEKN